jgi:hypothetical protein
LGASTTSLAEATNALQPAAAGSIAISTTLQAATAHCSSGTTDWAAR